MIIYKEKGVLEYTIKVKILVRLQGIKNVKGYRSDFKKGSSESWNYNNNG